MPGSPAQPLALRLRGSSSEPSSGDSDRGALQAGAAGTGPIARIGMKHLILACLAISAFTLLLPSAPTYDPWAWIMWGREITQLDLVTEGGPSWKPLPVLFTTVFSLFGDDAAPLLWLWIARAGALLALALAFRVARRLIGGGVAGAIGGLLAAAFLATTFHYIRDGALGNSEAMLAAFALWAFERHLDGRRDHALYLLFAAALLRPEVWPFLGLYGLWLWFAERRLRARLVAFAVAIPALWFLPELWGSGDWLRASERANNPNRGSAAFAEHPGWEVVRRFLELTIAPLLAAAALGAGLALWNWFRERKDAAIVALGAAGLAWILLVAGMTEGGYAGNQRYLIVTTAVVAVLGGVGIGRAFGFLEVLGARLFNGRRAGLVTAAAVSALALVAGAPVIKDKLENGSDTFDLLGYEASLWDELDTAINRAGGPAALRACGAFASGPYQTQLIAYELGLHGHDVGDGRIATPVPGVVFRTRTTPTSPTVPEFTQPGFDRVSRTRRWSVYTAAPGDNACPYPTTPPGA